MSDVAKIDLPYVKAFRDRHGRQRHYFRKRGCPSVALPGLPGSAEFMAAYAVALDQRATEGAGAARTKPKTINALLVAYYLSPPYKRELKPRTQLAYRQMLDRFREKHGDKSALTIQPKHINAILAEMGDTPAQASNLRKRLLAVFRLAVSMGWRHDNPVRETERIQYKVLGFTPWSEADIEQFRDFHGDKSKAVQALTVLLCTGIRRSDAHTLGRQHLKNGQVSVCQDKGGARLTIPAHHDLLALADSLPPGQMTFILTDAGAPYSEGGFTNWFVKMAKRAGLEGRTPHGLRKAVGRRLAEAGCSEKQIAAVLGHEDPNTAKIYTKSADQTRLAEDAMGKIGVKREQQVV